ncbi:hypothetical protein BDDG_12412, partial [Blastomyces dermatitidis ATCC 18188]
REDKETVRLCKLNSAVFQAELRYITEEKLQIRLLRAAISEIKLFSRFSLNDHTGSYITVLTEEENDVITAVKRVEKELNIDELISRRDNTSLQGMATITAAARDIEEEDVIMRAVLLQLIDTAVFIFNLAFLTVMEAAAAL